MLDRDGGLVRSAIEVPGHRSVNGSQRTDQRIQVRPAVQRPVASDRVERAERIRDRHGMGRVRLRDPVRRSRSMGHPRPGDPRDPSDARPREQLRVVAAHAPAPQRDDHERAAHHLERHVRSGEAQALLTECPGDLHRHDQADQHQHDQEAPHCRVVGVDPVGGPGSVVPGPPHRQEEHERLDGAAHHEVLKKMMGELRDREHVDEVEKQLHIGDRGGLTPTAVTENSRGHRHPGGAPSYLVRLIPPLTPGPSGVDYRPD